MYVHRDPCCFEIGEATSCYLRVRILHRCNYPRDPGLNQGRSTRGGAAFERAGLQRNVCGGTAYVLIPGILERVDLGMTFPGTDMPTPSQHFAIANYDAADPGIWGTRVQSATGEFYCRLQVESIGIPQHLESFD